MNAIFRILIFSYVLVMISCNESRRGNDSNLGEDRNEAAEEGNADKFKGKEQNDADFVYKVVESNYAEIKLAQIAAQRSTDPTVKQIATKIVDDHTKALNELKVLAQSKAIGVPVQETDQAKRKLKRFSDKSKEDFDKEWCKEMMDIHDSNIDDFEKRLDKTEDEALKAWINKTLPTLKMHHQQVESCHEKVANS